MRAGVLEQKWDQDKDNVQENIADFPENAAHTTGEAVSSRVILAVFDFVADEYTDDRSEKSKIFRMKLKRHLRRPRAGGRRSKVTCAGKRKTWRMPMRVGKMRKRKGKTTTAAAAAAAEVTMMTTMNRRIQLSIRCIVMIRCE